MNIHHYSINASQLVAASSRFNKAFDLPIWYGEVGCQVRFLLRVISDGGLSHFRIIPGKTNLATKAPLIPSLQLSWIMCRVLHMSNISPGLVSVCPRITECVPLNVHRRFLHAKRDRGK